MAVRVTLPLVPLIVKVYVPVGAFLLGRTVSVEFPPPVTEIGLKLALVLAGSPVTLRLTVPLKPDRGVTATV